MLTEVTVEAVEVVNAKPARRTRTRKVEVVEPEPVLVPVQLEIVEAKPARRTRTKKVVDAEASSLNGNSAEPLPIPTEMTLPLPDPSDGPTDVVPARRTRARRTTKAS
jgi:hypothetical protein